MLQSTLDIVVSSFSLVAKIVLAQKSPDKDGGWSGELVKAYDDRRLFLYNN